MKQKLMVLCLAATLVMAAVMISGCGEKTVVGPDNGRSTTTQTSSDSTVNLNFEHPVTMSEVGQYAAEHHLKVLEVRMHRPGYVAGFRLDGRNLAEVSQVFANEHRKFLTLLTSQTEPQFSVQRSAAMAELTRLNSSTLRISSIAIEGRAIEAKTLPHVTISEHPMSTDDPGPAVNPNSIKRDVAPNSLYHQSWAPYGGSSQVNKSYSYQTFIFNDLSKLGSGMATYEHETHIWDKNYANQSGYWASNLPNPYLDCGNADSVDNFAVGSFTANQMRTYTWYYAYIGLVGQSAGSSTVSIWSQRGTRWASSCWTVTSNEHAGPLTTHYTGGSISWQF